MNNLIYRAWDKRKNQMYYDFVMRLWSDQSGVIYFDMDEEADEIDLDHLILMKDIGIRDKNDKQVFELDVVLHKERGMGIIKYDPSCGQYLIMFEHGWCDWEDPDGIPKGSVSGNIRKNFIEVIESIFDVDDEVEWIKHNRDIYLEKGI